MAMRMELGLCYRIVYADGRSVEFRFMGSDEQGRPIGEMPIGSGKREPLLITGYRDFYEIDNPIGEEVAAAAGEPEAAREGSQGS